MCVTAGTRSAKRCAQPSRQMRTNSNCTSTIHIMVGPQQCTSQHAPPSSTGEVWQLTPLPILPIQISQVLWGAMSKPVRVEPQLAEPDLAIVCNCTSNLWSWPYFHAHEKIGRLYFAGILSCQRLRPLHCSGLN